ncbi:MULTISPECIES: efflux RND transporter periplasmic adaptor subunit [unclassified Chromobacterium]|uniref:efflux RND transporter periplasmic adaptor subunit n=1 Tax=unclassified Chromobacterium TaxID=2641838 RepID=UPI000D3080F6|nr:MULTISPECIES: HlyD family efflux transporter periplasmic adaptor subunit [unclassified Chromobacterium]PTU67226.1 secretion protein HylD [Chromobacterium sp. Panama]UJB32608.1 HlyD family efflux transporter periplasmic adaptor subunit [Chromobacterium sp. Beijing]
MGHADRSRELAGLLQLLHRGRDAVSAEQLGFIIVNESQQLLPYRQSAVWREGLHRHVTALSGLAELDPTAPYMQWLSRLFRHLAESGGPEVGQDSRLLEAGDLPAALAEDWSSWLPAHALWLRLGEQGAWLLARELPWSDYERKLAEELAHGYGHALLRFAPRRNWRELAGQWLRPGRKQRRLLIAALLLACMPIRLSVLARGEVAPQNPVLLRAPLSGVIDRIQVQPNQRVKAGDPLFDLDATSLAGQFAMAARERDAAQESFRASAQLAVTDDKGKLAMAQDRAKLEEKSIAAEYTGLELQRLHVTAPSAGVVVFSDRNDWQGKAVTVGEKVMTLADPAHVELAAWLPAAEAIDVAPGGKITLYPNASPTESYDAEILRVAYKAEAVEGGLLAYRLQARFVGGDKPRLGQMGTARVYGDWVPLIYYALRRPLTAARQWLGW